MKHKSINAYLAAVPATHRTALKTLRRQIKKLYPKVTEHISYGMPLFKLDGHPLAGFRAARHHSSMFVWSGTALGTLGNLLHGYDTAQSTIRFAPDKPLPERIIKAVLAARAKEIADRWGRKER
jgi:uncharacterized protein YdhG (YjbR/CyaY superfamily)